MTTATKPRKFVMPDRMRGAPLRISGRKARTTLQCSICGNYKSLHYFPFDGLEHGKACKRCQAHTRVLRERLRELPPGPVPQKDPSRGHTPRYPLLPLQVLMRDRLAHTSRTTLSQELGMGSQTVRDVAVGRRHKTINLEKADRISMALGMHLDMVFGG
jgi:hypothetical protein